MKYKNLILVGTSHIAKQSLDDVDRVIKEKKPGIVCLELDRNRMIGLLNKDKTGRAGLRHIFKIGIKGYIFSLIGAWAEKKLGNIVGVSPGSEMVRAIKIARKKGIKIALIDQDISITLKRLSKDLTWREKWNFLVDIVKAVVLRQPQIKFDLTKVPSKKLIKKLTNEVKKRYPNVYKVLIEERNVYMAEKLTIVMSHNKEDTIVGIIGAGHEEEIIKLIKRFEKKIKKEDTEQIQVNYSYSVN